MIANSFRSFGAADYCWRFHSLLTSHYAAHIPVNISAEIIALLNTTDECLFD